jgi:hypothetical protein
MASVLTVGSAGRPEQQCIRGRGTAGVRYSSPPTTKSQSSTLRPHSIFISQLTSCTSPQSTITRGPDFNPFKPFTHLRSVVMSDAAHSEDEETHNGVQPEVTRTSVGVSRLDVMGCDAFALRRMLTSRLRREPAPQSPRRHRP